MALQTEVWLSDIQPNLFPNDSFISKAKDDSPFVSNKIVHLPQAGQVPTVQRNLTTLPAAITERVDSEATYTLQDFKALPYLVTDLDETEVSYAKRTSITYEMVAQINRKMADYLAFAWATNVAGQIIPTTGAVRTTNAPGGTGTRKSFTKSEVLAIKRIFDAQEIPQTDRFLLLDAGMYNDLLMDTQLLSRDFVSNPNLEMGTVGKLFGFDIYVRSSVGRYATGNAAPKDPDAANAATDNAFSLAWHSNFVRRALGAVKVFADENKPEYYGSIFSAEARAGGRQSYSNHRGVCSIVEVP